MRVQLSQALLFLSISFYFTEMPGSHILFRLKNKCVKPFWTLLYYILMIYPKQIPFLLKKTFEKLDMVEFISGGTVKI